MHQCHAKAGVCFTGSHDKDTLLAGTIAELLYPAAQHRRDGEPYAAFVARIKALFHKQVLAPLRKCLDVPEVLLHSLLVLLPRTAHAYGSDLPGFSAAAVAR